MAGPLTIERSRAYHREWLVKFAGADGREALEPWRGLFLAVPADQLTPPTDDEVYLHELDGLRGPAAGRDAARPGQRASTSCRPD